MAFKCQQACVALCHDANFVSLNQYPQLTISLCKFFLTLIHLYCPYLIQNWSP